MFFIIKQNLSIESPKKVEEKWRTFKHFHNATLKGKEREIGTVLWKNRAKKRTGKEKIIKHGAKEIFVENATKPRKLRNCHEPLLTRRRAFDPR